MRTLIISLNFNPGHVSHMVASYRQCEETGYESVFYVNKLFIPYLPDNSRVITAEEARSFTADLAIFLFPSQKNLPLIWKLKRHGTRIAYIFHEPLAPMKVYREAGFSLSYLVKLWIIDHISALTVKRSDVILIPSKKAVKYYEGNHLYRNRNYFYLPLMYSDEREKRHLRMPRMYFSYIGTVAADHSFQEYLDFVEWAVSEGKLDGVSFLIATKSDFEVPEVICRSSRVTVHKGKPMTDEEINAYYASTMSIWNAYARTTQSGVLAKSFMFGTPAVVLRNNLNEFTHDGDNVVAIDDNTDKCEIENAVARIRDDFWHFSQAARREFECSFYYGVYNNFFKEIALGKRLSNSIK